MLNIMNWNTLSDTEQKKQLARPATSQPAAIREKTQAIIQEVRQGGDQALLALTEKFDGVTLKTLAVTPDNIQAASQRISAQAKQAIQFAKQQLERNYRAQLPSASSVETCPGVVCQREWRAISRVGLYIPGGNTPLISTVLMLGVPALIANNPLRILCSPPNAQGEINPHILFAAQLCGIQQIYNIGGAQAIAAMAYGTATVPKVDKIFGPGNSWVTQAKMVVANEAEGAAIDLPAGPSEVLVIADEHADPDYVAADLLSQAEHGPDSQVILITLSVNVAERVQQALTAQLQTLPRQTIIKQALTYSRCFIVDNLQQALAISNRYAPEHLILEVNEPQRYTAEIQNAGAVFLGKWTPETLGDYVTGSNHVLPTYGYARQFSGLSVLDFMKAINFQSVTQDGLEAIGPYAQQLASLEGLAAHERAVTLRLEKTKVNA